MANVVGLQTDDADHVGQNSSAHVACVVGLQTDAVVVTETRFSSWKTFKKHDLVFLECKSIDICIYISTMHNEWYIDFKVNKPLQFRAIFHIS